MLLGCSDRRLRYFFKRQHRECEVETLISRSESINEQIFINYQLYRDAKLRRKMTKRGRAWGNHRETGKLPPQPVHNGHNTHNAPRVRRAVPNPPRQASLVWLDGLSAVMSHVEEEGLVGQAHLIFAVPIASCGAMSHEDDVAYGILSRTHNASPI